MGNNKWLRYSFVYLLILVALAALFFNIFSSPKTVKPFVNINQVITDAKSGLIERIEIQGGGNILITYADEPQVQYYSRLESGDSITRLLLDADVPLDSIDILIDQPSTTGDILTILSGLLPIIFVGGLFFFLVRQARSGNLVAKNVVKHNWKVEPKPSVRFADVGGLQEAKQAVEDLVAYLKEPNRFGEVGMEMPRAVLVQGPPGVGKSLFVRSVAGEAGVRLISCNSSEFIELFVGVAAARVRDLFQEAKRIAPVIVFIDELDSIGRERTQIDKHGSNSEQQLLLSQLFAELDQLKAQRGIVVFAATNRPELVDPALLRAGRLEKQINIGLPSEEERLEILKILVRGKLLAQDVRLEEIARQTPGRTGADLASIVNQAAILALKGTRISSGQVINYRDLEQAIDIYRSVT